MKKSQTLKQTNKKSQIFSGSVLFYEQLLNLMRRVNERCSLDNNRNQTNHIESFRNTKTSRKLNTLNARCINNTELNPNQTSSKQRSTTAATE